MSEHDEQDVINGEQDETTTTVAPFQRTVLMTAEQSIREVVWPEVVVDVHNEFNPITVDVAKDRLGWTETEDEKAWLFKDLNGVKIKCFNNVKNRPLYMNNVNSLMQEILNKRWRMNGEPIIISRYNTVLNGQHTLIAVVLAEQERVGRNNKYWTTLWGEEAISIPKIIVYGVEDSEDIVNTMDTCKPRSIADVIYRNVYFSRKSGKERREACKYTDNAIRFLWERTGAKNDPYAPMRTHTEALDFLHRHQMLVDCVGFVQGENEKGRITNILPPGRAAGLLYLMSASSTEANEYHSAENPSEAEIDFSLYEKATGFFIGLLSNDVKFSAVVAQLGLLGDGASIPERTAVLCKAWSAYKLDQPIDKKVVKLKWVEKNEKQLLGEHPDVGGIDLGPNPDPTEDQTLEEEASKEAKAVGTEGEKKARKPKSSRDVESDPTEEEVKKLAKNISDARKAEMQDKDEEQDSDEDEWKPVRTNEELSEDDGFGGDEEYVDEDTVTDDEPEPVPVKPAKKGGKKGSKKR